MAEPTPAPAPATPSAEPRPAVAWQPITPRGIAAFASASLGRLFLLQVVVALIAGGTVVWFLRAAWCPPIREAIRNLPTSGAFRAGELEVGESAIERLVTNRFLTFAIDPRAARRHSYSADVFVVFRRAHYEVCSLFGCAAYVYPVREGPFNRLELEAKWGAWEPVLLGMAAAGTALCLLAVWWGLATVYCPLTWVGGYFADRQLGLGGSWRLCGAALLAGTLLFVSAMAAYGLGALDLVRFAILAALHFTVPWMLIVFAVRACPPVVKTAANPFTGPLPGAPASG